MNEHREGAAENERGTGDVPSSNKKVIAGYPMTPAGYVFVVRDLGIDLKSQKELRLWLTSKASDRGRQLTKHDVEKLQPKIEELAKEETELQRRIHELPEGTNTDTVTGIEVVHVPNAPNTPAHLRISAITSKGFKINLRSVKQLNSTKIAEKSAIAKDFALEVMPKGSEVAFYKQAGPVGGAERYMHLRAKLEKENPLTGLTYQGLADWYKKKRKKE